MSGVLPRRFFMDIRSEHIGDKLEVWFKGEVCAECVPEAEAFLNGNLGGIKNLVIDFGGVKRLAKEGVMLLLSTKKKLGDVAMSLVNVREDIYDKLEEQGVTTLIDISKAE